MSMDVPLPSISARDIEQLSDLSFNDSLAIAAYQAVIYRNANQLLSLMLNELFIFGLLQIFILPVSLIVLRNFGLVSDTPSGMLPVLTAVIGLSLIIFLVWNTYLWRHANQLQILARLIRQVDRFNRMTQIVDRMEQQLLGDRQGEAIAALRQTRTNLVEVLKMEATIRKSQGLVQLRPESLTAIETNLTDLMALSANPDVNQCHPILDAALEINLNVHRELTRLSTEWR